MRQHVEMYQACRSDMVVAYDNKVKELEEAKSMVSQASASLMGEVSRNEAIPMPEVAQGLQAFQQMAQQQPPAVHFLADEVQDVEDMEEDGSPTSVTEPAALPSMTPFHATAPNRSPIRGHSCEPAASEERKGSEDCQGT